MKLNNLYKPLKVIKKHKISRFSRSSKNKQYVDRVMKPDTGETGVSPETRFLPYSQNRVVMPDRSV